MVLVLIRYIKPLADVQSGRAAHRAFLDECVASGHLIVSGPREDQTGGILLARGRSVDEVRAIFAKDPFQTSGLASYEFVEFTPAKHAPGFAAFLTPA